MSVWSECPTNIFGPVLYIRRVLKIICDTNFKFSMRRLFYCCYCLSFITLTVFTFSLTLCLSRNHLSFVDTFRGTQGTLMTSCNRSTTSANEWRSVLSFLLIMVAGLYKIGYKKNVFKFHTLMCFKCGLYKLNRPESGLRKLKHRRRIHTGRICRELPQGFTKHQTLFTVWSWKITVLKYKVYLYVPL